MSTNTDTLLETARNFWAAVAEMKHGAECHRVLAETVSKLETARERLQEVEKNRALMEKHAMEGWDLANKRTRQWKAAEERLQEVAAERDRLAAAISRELAGIIDLDEGYCLAHEGYCLAHEGYCLAHEGAWRSDDGKPHGDCIYGRLAAALSAPPAGRHRPDERSVGGSPPRGDGGMEQTVPVRGEIVKAGDNSHQQKGPTQMKTIVETSEASGLESLLGENVTLFCNNYFYTGKLVGVDADTAKLENPSIVYETGPWTDKQWQDAQKLPAKTLFVRIDHIEAYGVLK